MGVLEPDQPRRVNRAHAHREDAAEALLGEPVLIEHLHAQVVLGRRLLGRRGQVGGHHVGGCGVDQIPHQRHRLGQDPGPAHGVMVRGVHDQLEVARRIRGRPVLTEGIAAEQRAERHRLGLVGLPAGESDGSALGPV